MTDVANELSRIGDALTQFSEDFHFIVESFRPGLEDVAEDLEDIAIQDLVEAPQ